MLLYFTSSRNQQRHNQSINQSTVQTSSLLYLRTRWQSRLCNCTLSLSPCKCSHGQDFAITHYHLSPCKCSHGQDFAIAHSHLSPCKCSHGQDFAIAHSHLSPCKCSHGQDFATAHSHLSPCKCSRGQDFAIAHSHLSPCECSHGQLHILTFLLVSVLVNNLQLVEVEENRVDGLTDWTVQVDVGWKLSAAFVFQGHWQFHFTLKQSRKAQIVRKAHSFQTFTVISSVQHTRLRCYSV